VLNSRVSALCLRSTTIVTRLTEHDDVIQSLLRGAQRLGLALGPCTQHTALRSFYRYLSGWDGGTKTKNNRTIHKGTGVIYTAQCCNLSASVALNLWFTTNGMCAKNNNVYTWREQAIIEWLRPWSLLLFVATVWSFAHMPLGLSDCNNRQFRTVKCKPRKTEVLSTHR